jgi:hypothetical protein
MNKRFLTTLFFTLLLSSNASLSNQSDTGELEQQLLLLDKISYHPSLLPLIMENVDYLELTPAQQKRLREWRTINAPQMLDKMREVAQGRIEFIELSLQPGTSDEELVEKQRGLFRLQEEVLSYKLACRKNILETFTEAQWDTLLFILAARQTETIANRSN